MYVCTICNLFAGQSFSAVLRHMGVHRFDPGLSIRCGINSCTEQYTNFESFRSHIYRKHREVLVSAPVTDSALAETVVSGRLEQGGSETDDDGLEVEQRTCNDDPKRSAALFLLKAREERRITQTALNGIVQDFQGLWRDAMERLQVRQTIFLNWYINIIYYYTCIGSLSWTLESELRGMS